MATSYLLAFFPSVLVYGIERFDYAAYDRLQGQITPKSYAIYEAWSLGTFMFAPWRYSGMLVTMLLPINGLPSYTWFNVFDGAQCVVFLSLYLNFSFLRWRDDRDLTRRKREGTAATWYSLPAGAVRKDTVRQWMILNAAQATHPATPESIRRYSRSLVQQCQGMDWTDDAGESPLDYAIAACNVPESVFRTEHPAELLKPQHIHSAFDNFNEEQLLSWMPAARSTFLAKKTCWNDAIFKNCRNSYDFDRAVRELALAEEYNTLAMIFRASFVPVDLV